jgi:hypothetical protein
MAKHKHILNQSAGNEPRIESITDSNDSRLIDIFSWYRNKGINEKTRAWVVEYMQSRFTPDEVERYRKSKDSLTTETIVAVARQVSLGAKLPHDMLDRLNGKLRDIVSVIEEKEQEKEQKPVINIQARVRESASWVIAEINGFLDDSMDGKPLDHQSAYDILTKADSKAVQARIVLDHITPLMEETLELKAGTCPQLNEAYAHMNAQAINSYVNLVRSIVADVERYLSNQKAANPRRTRKKKVHSASKLVEAVQYLPSCQELKIVSVSPEQIVGAETVWLFNVKSRKLTKLIARTREGLSVKGTTVQNFDVDNSLAKTLRKPDQVIPRVLDGGKLVLRKLMDGVRAKKQEASGRLNTETVILRAMK